MSTMHCSLLSLGCVFGFAPPADKAMLTALRALKIAQRRLRPEVRAKLLSASSSRTDTSLVPEAWRFVFQDLATSGSCRVVTVAAKASSEHPDTVEAFSSLKGEDVSTMHAIPQNKLVVDSTQALEMVRSVAKIKTIQAVDFRLVQTRHGNEPLWVLQLFADGKDAMERFQVGAKTGTVGPVADEINGA